MSDDQPNISSCGMSSDDPLILPSTLSDIFVYRWVESIVDTFVDMRVHLQSENQFRLKLSHLFVRSRYLKRKLERGIPNLFYASEAFYFAEQYLLCLKNAMSISENNASHSEESASLSFIMSQARKMLNGLISNLTSTDRTTLTQELLVTANVIFCTLSTAGTSLMKRTKRINDLFVDEAAAATEPQICIPFHLRPERMLAVGDHMQLPSTVMSRCAANLGLDKSLHERLISDCGKDHKMLETQYRMKVSPRFLCCKKNAFQWYLISLTRHVFLNFLANIFCHCKWPKLFLISLKSVYFHLPSFTVGRYQMAQTWLGAHIFS